MTNEKSTVDRLPQYVFMLPFAVTKELAAMLDPDNAWEALAFVLPDIRALDVQACRNARNNESPTESLLAIWGSKGNKIVQLYNRLGRARLVRAMAILRRFVDPRYHHWEKECLQPRKLFVNKSIELMSEASSSISALNNFGTATTIDKDTSKLQKLTKNENDEYSESQTIYASLHNTVSIKYSEIVRITDNFSDNNIIGMGGYGTVYKGFWEHTHVAVKRVEAKTDVENEKEQIRQSLQELKTLSKYRHDNILPLYAYSLDGSEPCLLYQYMANGSLVDCLFKTKSVQLSWSQRISIIVGCLRALHYLHSIARTPIIHGDVKSANILLDKHFEPKLGDFGLCRHTLSNAKANADGVFVASHVRGTLAYLPIEFLRSGIMSTKLDVYGFGVVALEIATGLKAYLSGREPQNITDFVRNHCETVDDVESLRNLADSRCNFENDADQNAFLQIMQTGWRCTDRDYGMRPSFSEILDSLLFD